MPKDPVCGMEVVGTKSLKLKKNGGTYFFCSEPRTFAKVRGEHCLRKFAQQGNVDDKEVATCLVRPRRKWYRNRLVLICLGLILFSLLSYFLPVLEPWRKFFWLYLGRIWWAILLGIILGGVIDYFVPREYVSHILAQPRGRTIFHSVLLGFFMSACSHGILALAIELHKKGASNPAVIAFLLVSPWANLPLTIMLLGFFGLKALYIVFSALLIAIISGFIYQFLERKNLIEKNKNIVETEPEFSILQDFKKRFRAYRLTGKRIRHDLKGVFSGSFSLANMLLWWLLVGIALASLAAAYIPQSVFQNYMGPQALGLLVTLMLATILEVCSEGTAPLAFEIYRQTAALGNAFVFLMGGVVTDYTEIGLLWFNVGKKVAIWLPIVTIPQVVILGILANVLWK